MLRGSPFFADVMIRCAIRDVGADYLLSVKNTQPGQRAEMQALFNSATPNETDRSADLDKGHGRIEERSVILYRETDWLAGDRRFPGELRLPGAATVIRVDTRTEIKDRTRAETRSYISSASLSARAAAEAVRDKLDNHSLKNRRKMRRMGTNCLASILNMKIP